MNKVISLDDAVSVVSDGSHIGLTGFAITRNSMAVAHALARAGRRELTVSQVIAGLETDLLAAAGCLRRLEFSGGSLDRFGQLFSLNRAITAGQVEAIEYSSLALTLRLMAGSLGLPFIPMQAMLGSALIEALVKDGSVVISDDPFNGGPAALASALRPDVVFVHVDVADCHGNAAIAGPTWSIRETALAGRHIALTCEELVPVGSIDPNQVAIPGAVVNSVTVSPRAALPTAVYGRYDYDREELIRYADVSREGGARLESFLDQHIHGVGDFDEYLSLVGSTS